MTEPESPGPEATRPERVVQAIPLQAVASPPAPTQSAPSQAAPSQSAPSQSAPSQSAPSQSAPSPGVPPQAVPSQAALFRERRRPADDDEMSLLTDAAELRNGWQKVKAGFVDNPRGSVAEAASLVEKATDRLIAALRARQDRIRDSWDGDAADDDTESLRQALLTYQSLFNHIAVQ